jgi:hypothetical protein
MPILAEGCRPFHGQGDAGRIAVGGVWQAAAAVLAAANIAVSAVISEKQFDLARLYFRISRNWRDWYNKGFVPLENKELDEVLAYRKAEPHYDAAVGRAMVQAKGMMKGAADRETRCFSQYETGMRGYRLRKVLEAAGRAAGAAAGLGYRNERGRIEIYNVHRWQRKESAVNRGRDMMAQNVVYGRLASGIFGSLSNQAGAAAGGFISVLADRERLNTIYPNRIMYDMRNPSDPNFRTGAYAGKASEYRFDEYSNWQGPDLSWTRRTEPNS